MLNDFKTIFDFIASTATVFIMFWRFQNWFFDYKFNQKMSELKAKRQKENRCSKRKDEQR